MGVNICVTNQTWRPTDDEQDQSLKYCLNVRNSTSHSWLSSYLPSLQVSHLCNILMDLHLLSLSDEPLNFFICGLPKKAIILSKGKGHRLML